MIPFLLIFVAGIGLLGKSIRDDTALLAEMAKPAPVPAPEPPPPPPPPPPHRPRKPTLADKVAARIEGKVQAFRVARGKSDKYAGLYKDPTYGQDLKDAIEQEVRFAIKGDDFRGFDS